METSRCGPLPTFAHAVPVDNNSSFVVGNTVLISCQSGYTPAITRSSSHLSGGRDVIVTSYDDELVSSLTVVCLEDLTWSSPRHVCQSTCVLPLNCLSAVHTGVEIEFDFVKFREFSTSSPGVNTPNFRTTPMAFSDNPQIAHRVC